MAFAFNKGHKRLNLLHAQKLDTNAERSVPKTVKKNRKSSNDALSTSANLTLIFAYEMKSKKYFRSTLSVTVIKLISKTVGEEKNK